MPLKLFFFVYFPSGSKEVRAHSISLLKHVFFLLSRDSLSKALTFYDISAFDSGLDYLFRLKDAKVTAVDFLLFTSQKEVHNRIEMVVNKKLYAGFIGYFSLILKEKEEELLVSDEVSFVQKLKKVRTQTSMSGGTAFCVY